MLLCLILCFSFQEKAIPVSPIFSSDFASPFAFFKALTTEYADNKDVQNLSKSVLALAKSMQDQ